MKTLQAFLKRIFVTNWKTSLCGIILLFALAGKWTGKLDREEFLYTMGLVVTSGLLLSKDGVRDEQRVAPEDTDAK